MYKIEKDKIIKDSSILRGIAFIQLFFILLFCFTPIAWVWLGLIMAKKLMLTSIFVVLIFRFFHMVIVKVITDGVESEVNNKTIENNKN